MSDFCVSENSANKPVRQLNWDALSDGVAQNLNNNWDRAVHGDVNAAADLQQFVERAQYPNADGKMLALVLAKTDPNVEKHLRQAIISHDVIKFE